jgi:HSP20 family protein
MARLRREMNRVFSGMQPSSGTRVSPGYPSMNVWANEEGLVVTAELPGIDSETLDISVVNNTLTLKGNRAPENLGEGEVYHRREREYGNFTRAFQLPFDIEANAVEAVYDKGVLQITLPCAEADKPKKITVRVA